MEGGNQDKGLGAMRMEDFRTKTGVGTENAALALQNQFFAAQRYGDNNLLAMKQTDMVAQVQYGSGKAQDQLQGTGMSVPSSNDGVTTTSASAALAAIQNAANQHQSAWINYQLNQQSALTNYNQQKQKQQQLVQHQALENFNIQQRGGLGIGVGMGMVSQQQSQGQNSQTHGQSQGQGHSQVQSLTPQGQNVGQGQGQAVMHFSMMPSIAPAAINRPNLDVHHQQQMVSASNANGNSSGGVSPMEGAPRGKKRGGEVVEKVVERRQKRMIKNRESAARSRARKQAYTVELEAEIVQLKEENDALRRQQDEESQERRRQIMEAMMAAMSGNQPPERGLLRRSRSGPW